MKILLVNTSSATGGAAIAARRLMDALEKNGAEVKMLVRDKDNDDPRVVALPPSFLLKAKFVAERAEIFLENNLKKHRLFEVDHAAHGTDITRLPIFDWADVIHLHWVNQGMLSLDDIGKILQSGKQVWWTLHDMWPFTGICHYAHDCDHYTEQCHDCPQLNSRKYRDMAYRIFKRKEQMLQGTHIQFVACSRWLGNMAINSHLLHGCKIQCVPNAINTNLFRPRSKQQAREALGLPTDKRLILFSSHSLADERKGYHYLKEAVKMLSTEHPEWRNQLGVVLIGKNISPALYQDIPFDVYPLSYVAEEKRLVEVYNAVDLFAIPSLQDNLPNTIVEAMACGVPCIGFSVGGIPEMIDHLHNGYVADYKNVSDFAAGIHWLLTEGDYEMLSREAARKAANTYGENSVAMKYISIYNRMTGKNE